MRVPRFPESHPYSEHFGAVYDPQVRWDGPDLFNEAVGDIYSSRGESIGETDAVFIGGNRLPERFESERGGFCVGELGFGTGLNFLRTWITWTQSKRGPGMLTYFSTEHAPLSTAILSPVWASIREQDPDLAEAIALLEKLYPVDPHPGFHVLPFLDAGITLVLAVGDGLRCLKQWDAGARGVQAWYLDGFAPSKNPDFWNAEICAEVARHSRPGATFSTYTASGAVKRALIAAGFEVRKVPGFGRKFERLQGHFSGEVMRAQNQPGRFRVVGAGVAGGSLAASLARRGAQVDLIDSADTIASGASGNPHGFWRVRPNLLSLAAAPVTRRLLEQVASREWFDVTGALDVFDQSDSFQKAAQRAEHWQLSRQGVEIWDAGRVRRQLPERREALGGLWTSHAGWLRPRDWIQSRLEVSEISVSLNTNEPLHTSSHNVTRIWCGGGYATDLNLRLSAVAGTVFFGANTPLTHHPAFSVHGNGFLGPSLESESSRGFTLGTTYERTDEAPWSQVIAKLARNWNVDSAQWIADSHRRSLRASTPDRKPILEQLDNGDWIFSGLGSHGLSTAPALAEHLASVLTGGPRLLPNFFGY